MNPLLEIKRVYSGYQDINILWDINLEINKGQIVKLLGPNGAGKSTLLNTIMGILKCTKGQIIFNGEDITNKSVRERVEMGLTLVPEGRQLFPELSVQENLEVAALATKSSIKAKEENLSLVYQLFPRLKERLKQRAETLSGGEQQMLTIARALMTNPVLLMLDEPSQSLAPRIIEEIYDAILRLNKQKGLTIILSEQQITKVLDESELAVVLEFGKVVFKGPTRNIMPELKKIYVG
ncbi:MAG: ABC transporter ATP-binding protein [Candidatus Methanomethylicia archaeon]